MLNLQDIDRAILDDLQNDFPLSVQPYQEMAKKLDISEAEIFERIARMKASGLIRRIGGIIDSRNLGFYSTLCAVAVPEVRIDSVAAVINQLPGVTHNYLRDNTFNMWFTLTASSDIKAAETIRDMEGVLGLKIIAMPARKVYKIKVSFDMGSKNE